MREARGVGEAKSTVALEKTNNGTACWFRTQFSTLAGAPGPRGWCCSGQHKDLKGEETRCYSRLIWCITWFCLVAGAEVCQHGIHWISPVQPVLDMSANVQLLGV